MPRPPKNASLVPIEITADDFINSYGIFDNDQPSNQIEINRDLFLSELRSGKYKKGTTKSDEKGFPVFEKPGDDDGYCACAIMLHLFDPGSVTSMKRSREALGLTVKDCTFIQQDINDSDLTFDQIANRIEKEVFKR